MSHIRSKRKRNGNKIKKTEVRILQFFLPSCFAKGALLHIENWQENQKLAFFNERVSIVCFRLSFEIVENDS